MTRSKIVFAAFVALMASAGGYASNKAAIPPPYYYLTGDTGNPCTDYTPDFECTNVSDIDCTITEAGPLNGKILHELPNCTVPLEREEPVK